jgi:hypothetical protein
MAGCTVSFAAKRCGEIRNHPARKQFRSRLSPAGRSRSPCRVHTFELSGTRDQAIDVNMTLTAFGLSAVIRTAVRYSNPCALGPSWTAANTRTRLHSLTMSWAAPVVCIQTVMLER